MPELKARSISHPRARSRSNPITKLMPGPEPLRKSGSQTAEDDPAPVKLNVIAGHSESARAGTSRPVCGQLSLPDGRTLTVRAITQADVEGLDTLFGRLCEEDQYHRFFHRYYPNQKFLEQMSRAGDDGGYRLVAVASGPPDSVVAEAGYAILPDGDGEFSLTVAPGWQGWRLGSHLLDILVAAAAARGVPNLQADIMLNNTRMLALLSRRGYQTLDQYELREARVAIAAAQPARGGPRWRGYQLFPGRVSAAHAARSRSAS